MYIGENICTYITHGIMAKLNIMYIGKVQTVYIYCNVSPSAIAIIAKDIVKKKCLK